MRIRSMHYHDEDLSAGNAMLDKLLKR